MTKKKPSTTDNALEAKERGSKALPLGRKHMPTDYSISLAAYTGRGTDHEARIPDDFGPKQSMRGFESTYQNIIDYIVRITLRIWRECSASYYPGHGAGYLATWGTEVRSEGYR